MKNLQLMHALMMRGQLNLRITSGIGQRGRMVVMSASKGAKRLGTYLNLRNYPTLGNLGIKLDRAHSG